MGSKLFRGLAIAAALVSVSSCEDAAAPFTPATRQMATTAPVVSLATLVKPNPSDITVSAAINERGGRIVLGDHELVIPRRTVTGVTRFVMTQRAGEYLIFDLHAYAPDGTELHTFGAEPQLKASYKALADVSSNHLAIAFLPDGSPTGEKQLVPSSVSKTARVVSANLQHFSSYSVAIN
jgi:hypothetical protein